VGGFFSARYLSRRVIPGCNVWTARSQLTTQPERITSVILPDLLPFRRTVVLQTPGTFRRIGWPLSAKPGLRGAAEEDRKPSQREVVRQTCRDQLCLHLRGSAFRGTSQSHSGKAICGAVSATIGFLCRLQYVPRATQCPPARYFAP